MTKITPNHPAMPTPQYINYLAIDLLERAGNTCPTQQEIDSMESVIKENLKKHGHIEEAKVAPKFDKAIELSQKNDS